MNAKVLVSNSMRIRTYLSDGVLLHGLDRDGSRPSSRSRLFHTHLDLLKPTNHENTETKPNSATK